MAPARKIVKKRKRGPKRVVRPKPQPARETRENPPPEPPKAPRPTRYTREIGERILERMANGETATAICRDPDMPKYAVLKRWERTDLDFAKRYEIARRQCVEYRTDEIAEIADDAVNDYVERVDAKGHVRVVFDREHFERSRLRVHSRQWEASKILRGMYGDKSEVDVRTPDGVNVKVEDRNALIDALVKLVHPKADGQTKPHGKQDEPRER